MDFFDMLLNDPVVYYSIIGLSITGGIFAFILIFFIKNIINDKQK
ncbi:hypothetical protein [Psychromonas hadalis]|nr:hypothetical protein [Psychromonas hadalis]